MIKKNIVDQIIKWITDGKSKGYIIQELTKEQPNDQESNKYAINLIDEAIRKLNEICNVPPAETIKVHVEHYERIYDYFKSIGHRVGANRALKAKEKLKGIFQSPKMTINQNIRTIVSNDVKYDTTKLSTEQLIRFEFLLKKAKV